MTEPLPTDGSDNRVLRPWSVVPFGVTVDA